MAEPRVDTPYDALLQQTEQLLALRADPRPWMERNLFIRTKDRRLLPLRFNPIQAYYYHRRTPRDIILKPRQVGFTTLNCGLLFADSVLRPHTVSAVVSRDADSALYIFSIIHRFWHSLPEEEQRYIGKPQYASREELSWPKLGSHIFVGTAGVLTAGRGQTIHNLLCSEFAFWPNPQEVLAALLEAVPMGGRVVIESTPNGRGNHFHFLWQQAQEGESGFRPHFHPWWQDPGNRVEGEPLGPLSEEETRLVANQGLDEAQLRWRRAKQRDLRERFPQEYPEDAISCFLHSGRCYFDLTAAQRLADTWVGEPLRVEDSGRLRIWKEAEPGKAYAIGADVAEGKQEQAPGGEERGGPDYSCAVIREWESGEQVAEWHGRLPEAAFAEALWQLQWRYPGRLICERNNSGAAVLSKLEDLCRDVLWRDSQDRRAGWRTTAASRPLLLRDWRGRSPPRPWRCARRGFGRK